MVEINPKRLHVCVFGAELFINWTKIITKNETGVIVKIDRIKQIDFPLFPLKYVYEDSN